MGDKSGIEWTDATWNPVVGCSVHSPGCKNCYAMPHSARMERMGVAKYAGLTDIVKDKPVFNGTVRLVPEALDQPLRWKRPRRIFVNSMSDLGHEALSRADVFQVLEIMEKAKHHVFQVLTKRPNILCGHVLDYLRAWASKQPTQASWATAFHHVWWGVSVEDQARANERLNEARRLNDLGLRVWVSYEPAIGPVEWMGWEFIAGMVSGGESGPGARISHPDWHRNTRDWCASHGIPYDFKQWGEWRPTDNWYPGKPATEAVVDWYESHPVSLPLREWINGAWVGDGGPSEEAWPLMARIGKRKAGRILFDQVHDGFTRACAPAGRA